MEDFEDDARIVRELRHHLKGACFRRLTSEHAEVTIGAFRVMDLYLGNPYGKAVGDLLMRLIGEANSEGGA